MKLHCFVGFFTTYKLAYQPMRTITSWHENTSVFYDRLFFSFFEMDRSCLKLYLKTNGWEILHCRSPHSYSAGKIRRSCGLILPNDTLKQFDHKKWNTSQWTWKKQSKLHCWLFEVHITLGSRSEVFTFIFNHKNFVKAAKGYVRIWLFFGPHYLSRISIQRESDFHPE